MRGRSYLNQDLGFGVLAVVVALVGPAGPVQAQDLNPVSPTQAAVRIGPLALSPVFRVTDFGFDSNVYNRDDDNRPVGDFTSRLTPSVDASLRSSRVRASGRSQFDIYYFKTLPDLSAVDSDNTAQVDLVVNRLTLFVGGRRETTRHRRNLEIDAIVKRRNADASFGGRVRLTGKTSIDMFVTRARLEYDKNSLYLGTDLANVLNHTSWSQGIAVGYAATSLTRFAVEASRSRAQFDDEVDRDSAEWRITPSVTFSPFALVSGRANFGYYKRTFSAVGSPSVGTSGSPSSGTSGSPSSGASESQSRGTSALVDLTYTLLGRTRFTVEASRKLEYSYLALVSDYTQSSVTGSVTQRLGESWDVVGRFGRARLSYQQNATTGVVAARIPPDETVFTSGADVGYNVRHTRLGLYVEHNQRLTDAAALNRGYQRVRIGLSATYVF